MLENRSTSPEPRAIAKLGGRCLARTCRWHNDDGTVGCNDERALNFHHKDGGGSAQRKKGRDSRRSIAYEILREMQRGRSPRFELLCACCHSIEGKVNKRAQGANQHEQPARVRWTQQKDEQLARRVRQRQEIEAEWAERRFLAAIRHQIKEACLLL